MKQQSNNCPPTDKRSIDRTGGNGLMAANTAPPDSLLTADECAAYLKIPVQTLYDWRYRGIGPRGHKVGKYLRFRLSEVDAWIDAQG